MTDRGQSSRAHMLINDGLVENGHNGARSMQLLTKLSRAAGESKWDSASFVYICNEDGATAPRKSSLKKSMKKTTSKMEKHLPSIVSPKMKIKG